jgi:hypothetical protein
MIGGRPVTNQISTKIGSVDYVLIDCGYYDRLDRKTMKKDIKEGMYKGKYLGVYINETTHIKIADSYEFGEYLKLGIKRSGVLIKCEDIREAFRAADILMKYDHCGGFSFNNLSGIEKIKVTIGDKNYIVVIIEFDTESG